jgi:hypothetical protein
VFSFGPVLTPSSPVAIIFYLAIQFYHFQTHLIPSYGKPVNNKSVRYEPL